MIRLHIFPVLFLLLGSCVEPFEPRLEESQEVLVISGMISDSPGPHTVSVSLSTPYRDPVYHPLPHCLVSVINQDGHMIHYLEEEEGIYLADIPDSFLEVGDAASVQVITEWGEYRSDYDTILPCPVINSLYWDLDALQTAEPGKEIPGVQFYLDMSGGASDSRNIMWQLEEAWEYTASLFGNIIWRSPGTGFEDFRSNVLYRCWKQYLLGEFYVATTRHLSSNELSRFRLNFVSNETDRLSITYSLLIKQQSLTRESFDYWLRMRDQALETGGLYEKQPSSVQGNLYNMNNPEEVVLGNFYATQIREQRIFIQNNNLFDFPVPQISCEYELLASLWQQEHIEYPVYIYSPGPFQPSYTGPSYCFDCMLQGGDTIRPEYWKSWE